MATLRVLKGSNKGSLIALSAECIVLGRDPSADIMLDGVSVSRKHAILRRIQGMYCIEDTKSCNGTFLNGKKVTSQMWLRDEDEITICDTVLV